MRVGTPAIEQARALLPAWVGWAGPVSLLAVSFLSAWVAATVAAAIATRPLRKLRADAEWTERARLAYPARVLTLILPFLLPLLATITAATVEAAMFTPLRPPALALLAWVASWLGAYLVRVRVDNRLRDEPLPLPRRLRGTLALWIIFLPGWLVVMLAWPLLPDRFNGKAVVLLILAGVLIHSMAWGLGVRLASLVGLARPASPRLAAIVEAAAFRTQVPAGRVFVMDWAYVNAAALVLPRWLLFTSAALETLTDEELGAITAHELGHLAEPTPVRVARAAGSLLPVPFVAMRPVMGTWGLYGVIAMYVLFVLAILLLRKLGRRMELRADETGQRHEGDPGLYARALEHLYRKNGMPAVTGSRRAVHPDLYDRLVAAGVTPAYPRPPGPPRWLAPGAYLVAILVSLAFFGTLLIGPPLLASRRNSEPSLYLAAALGSSTWSLGELALRRFDRGDYAGSAILFRACTALDQRSVVYPADLALVLARQGRCDEGARAYGIAVERFRRGGARRDDSWDALQGAIQALTDCNAERTGGGVGE